MVRPSLRSFGHSFLELQFTNFSLSQSSRSHLSSGTLDVRVRGDWLPASIAGRFTILFAILRQLVLILQIGFFSFELSKLKPTHFFIDQLSAGNPLLQWLCPNVPIFFYCHFPDMLLAQGRQKWWKRIYRIPFDRIEEWTMGFASEVAVNSEFTKGVAASTWPKLAARKDFRVVYPCIDITGPAELDNAEGNAVWTDNNIILSINRFERKKDVALAIKAFAALPAKKRKGIRLVIAGGYDLRSAENFGYHRELTDLATSLGLESFTAKNIITALSAPADTPVLFLLSIPGSLKASLLRSARLLVYTPSNEHFGIVPLEAMLSGVPVLAANTGGPKETVVEGETGWLREPGNVEQWADVMGKVLSEMSREDVARMGQAGAKRVKANFGQDKMGETVDGILQKAEPTPIPLIRAGVALFFAATAAFVSFAIGHQLGY